MYRARFSLLHFSHNLWIRKLPKGLHTYVPSKVPIATSNNPLSFSIHVSPLLNRRDFRVCLIIALPSVGMSIYTSANFKAFSNRGRINFFYIKLDKFVKGLLINTNKPINNSFCVFPLIKL